MLYVVLKYYISKQGNFTFRLVTSLKVKFPMGDKESPDSDVPQSHDDERAFLRVGRPAKASSHRSPHDFSPYRCDCSYEPNRRLYGDAVNSSRRHRRWRQTVWYHRRLCDTSADRRFCKYYECKNSYVIVRVIYLCSWLLQRARWQRKPKEPAFS